MSEKAIIRTSKTIILVFGLGFIGLLAGFYFNKIHKASAEGPIDFVEHVVTDTTDGANNVYTTDVDRDQDTDIINTNNDNIVWYENDGNGNFTEYNIGVLVIWQDIYPIDLDGDNDIDILGSALFYHTLVWYENDGNGNFTEHIITTSPAGPSYIYAIDLDKDNDMDFLGTFNGTDTIAWYENNGSESFTRHNITTSTNNPGYIYAIDLDSDNDIDVVSASNTDNTIYWFKNNGYQSFTRYVITNTAYNLNMVHAIDMDNDNDIDILRDANNQGNIIWYENDGNENFTWRVIYHNAFVDLVYAIDLDKDNDIDVLTTVGDYSYGILAWYENDGNEVFTEHMIANAPGHISSFYTVDFDHDTDIDIAITAENSIIWYENTSPILPPTCNDGIQNGDETGVDCGGSCQYSCTVPVIVVHGFTQDWQDIGTLATLLSQKIDQNKYPLRILDYAPGDCSLFHQSYCTVDSIENYADTLDSNINNILSTYNAKQVDLVGYSMGGLISRWYAQKINYGESKVRNLIQLATPNHGTKIMREKYIGLIEKFAFLTDFTAIYNGVTSTRELMDGSDFLKKLNGNLPNYDNIDPKIRYGIFGGTDSQFPFNKIIDGEDDRVVGAYSLKIYNSHVPDPVMFNYNHYNIDEQDDVAQDVADLINGTANMTFADPSMQREEPTEDVQQVSLIEDSVPGQKSHTVSLDNVNYAYFLMSYEGQDTNLIIESPDHTMYTTEATSTLRYLQIDNPLPGEWTLTASSTNADYQIFTFAETNVILDSNLETTVIPGDNILISASLTSSSTPVIGAQVMATITDDQDNQYILNLADQGSGIYSGIFSNTDNPGYYDLAISASTTIAGFPTNREVYSMFNAVDYPDVRVNNLNGTFDNQNYTITLTATVENTANVVATDFTLRFYDQEYNNPSILLDEITFSLNPHEQREIIINFEPDSGNQDYAVFIPGFNDEDDYDNNDAQFSIYIPSKCSDGTNPNQCSQNKPMYCVDGELVNNCQLCGCPTDYKCRQSNNMCVYYHQELPIPASMF